MLCCVRCLFLWSLMGFNVYSAISVDHYWLSVRDLCGGRVVVRIICVEEI